MSGSSQRQVHPAASAALILITLVAVQWTWWRFLIYRAPSPPVSGGPGPAAAIASDIHVQGRAEVYVQTIGGDVMPGDADGPSHASRFDRPTGIALDSRGDAYIADTGNNRIRMISPAADTTTVAGAGPAGYADGPAAQAQ
ncbi:MAG TPA: hypothetical protein VKT77_21245, partial [Chthonomonadaceae bacterium]|nr:hypothetical protein [Chthonomonadaceae bacterium]